MNQWIEAFHFIRPAWLLAIIPAILIWWLLRKASDPRRSMQDDIAPHLLNQLVTKPKNRPKLRPITLLLPIWIVASIAAAGPTFEKEDSPFAEDSSTLMIVVRMSDSIMLDDLQPTRLERVRLKVHDLLELREGSVTGLIAYSGSAHLVMPPTVDGGVIEQMFESLDPGVMPQEGDVLDEALRLADKRIEMSERSGSILVITDSIEPATAARMKSWRDQSKTVVQFLVPVAADTPIESTGVPPVATEMKASLQPLTIDEADITAINRRAESSIVAATGNQSQRWRDDGYWLVPLLAVGMAFWSRKGWSISST